MKRTREESRRIMLFVEGDSERGEARRRPLPEFFHKWLDPQLPAQKRVGIVPRKFQGVSNYLDDLAQQVEMHLDQKRANYIVGLVDLYGLPGNKVNLTGCANVMEKVESARRQICELIPARYRGRFSQHFAVHETEAWLLAYPEAWPPHARDQIAKRAPEHVNSKEPPAAFLKRILGGRYKKTVHAMNLFPKVDPQTAIAKCPNLKLLVEDLLRIARALQ